MNPQNQDYKKDGTVDFSLEVKNQQLESTVAQLEAEKKELEEKNKQLKEIASRISVENERLRKLSNIVAAELLPSNNDLILHQKIMRRTDYLPNATQGRAYEYVFNTADFGVDKIVDQMFIFTDDIGLVYEKETKTIKGIPGQKGDFMVEFRYLLANSTLWVKTKLHLVVNPDPRSLWKDLPTDPDAPYFKTDTDHRQLAISNTTYNIIGASKRGRSHAQDGKFRDDHFTMTHDEASGWSLVCVADGAGSAKFSREGSKIACETVEQYFNALTADEYAAFDQVVVDYHTDNEKNDNAIKAFLYNKISKSAFDALTAIREKARQDGHHVKDFATTIVFSLFKKYDFGWFFVSFGIGDSPMGIYRNNPEPPQIFKTPEEGEYSGQTHFLTMSDWYKDGQTIIDRMSYKIVPDFIAAILMTDGIYDPMFETVGNLHKIGHWDKLLDDIRNKNQAEWADTQDPSRSALLLDWLDFWSVGNHDDRTIVIIV